MSSQLLLGLLLGMAMALGGYWRGALSESGAVAAAMVGAIIFGVGGWTWGVLLVAFFVASSALSLYNPRRKQAVAAEKFDKGSRRDWEQVVANGGWVALLALLSLRVEGIWLFPAVVGALAAVTADTWATELGTLSPQPPRLITTFDAVPPGTSGGVTLLGTVATLAGGWFIGVIAMLLARFGDDPLPVASSTLLLIATLSGLGGSILDSLLGATVQHVRWCPRCQTETEQSQHRCGAATHPLRGWPWLDNDMVNFLASVTGSVIAIWLTLFLAR